MSETTDRQALNMLTTINANLVGRGKAMAENNSQMMLKVLIEINNNLSDIRRLLNGPNGEGLRVRSQESHS